MKGKAAWNNWPLKKLLLDKISVPKSIYSLKALLQTRVFFFHTGTVILTDKLFIDEWGARRSDMEDQGLLPLE